MKKYRTLIIIGAIVLVLVIWLVSSYTGMLNNKVEVDTAWGNVENQ